MALLCITTTRAFHSACKSSDIFPKKGVLATRHFFQESLKLISRLHKKLEETRPFKRQQQTLLSSFEELSCPVLE